MHFQNNHTFHPNVSNMQQGDEQPPLPIFHFPNYRPPEEPQPYGNTFAPKYLLLPDSILPVPQHSSFQKPHFRLAS